MGATQWTAAALGYQKRLGEPWFEWVGTPLYHPWRLREWWLFFDAYAQGAFNFGGSIAAWSGLLALVVDIAMAIWRARPVTTYGSARLADVDEVREVRLTRLASVFLRLFEEQYLRHEGPEHVLAVAPTCSGSGVGLVVLTLLSWPASAVIFGDDRACAHMSSPATRKQNMSPESKNGDTLCIREDSIWSSRGAKQHS